MVSLFCTGLPSSSFLGTTPIKRPVAVPVSNNSKPVQDIVPEPLLKCFIDMAKVHTVEPERVQHCAYFFPAVAITLGPQNWRCISDLYGILALDRQVFI